MRQAAKVDRNHSQIVAALRACGCSVLSCAALGKGAPDIIVGIRGKNFMMEIKDGTLSPSRQKLTTDEVRFRELWRGHYSVVTSVAEALGVVGLVR